MAYVCLGRTQQLKDIYIKGEFDPKGIHANPKALEESKRLQNIYDQRMEKINKHQQNHWKLSYLNVQSLKKHKEDVQNDNFIMSADIFALGETWLEKDQTISFTGFKEYYANFGRGKGVSVFSKMRPTR